MPRIRWLLAATCFTVAAPLAALSLEEIVDRHIAARGGAERLQAVEDARVTGTMSPAAGLEIPFTLEWKRPNRIRLELLVEEQRGVRAFDGEVGWSHLPFLGQEAPATLPAEEVRNLEQTAADLLEGPLLGALEKGHRVELMAAEEVDGRRTYRLKLTLRNGEELDLWLDADHFLEVQQRGSVTSGGREIEIVTVFGDYREVAGLTLPFELTTRAEGPGLGVAEQRLEIDTYRFDVGVDDDRFRMPGLGAAGVDDEGS